MPGDAIAIEHQAGVRQLSYAEAIREALAQAMEADPRVFLFGEDVGVYGGAFGVSGDLLHRFGPERVIDMPISELGLAGAAMGATSGAPISVPLAGGAPYAFAPPNPPPGPPTPKSSGSPICVLPRRLAAASAPIPPGPSTPATGTRVGAFWAISTGLGPERPLKRSMNSVTDENR